MPAVLLMAYVILLAHTVLSSLRAPLAVAGSCVDQGPAPADPRAASQPSFLSNVGESGNKCTWQLTSSSVKASHFTLNRHMIHHLLLLTVPYAWSDSLKQH